MNGMNQRVAGTILNLCHARGFETEKACNLLFGLIRVIANERPTISPHAGQRAAMRENEARDENASNLGFGENHPLYHKARTRICRMEKELTRIRSGEISTLNRKAWRKDKSDQVAVIDTFSHVIARASPQTPEDRVKDALMLLYRTGEIIPPDDLRGRIMSYEGKPGVQLSIEYGKLILKRGDASPVKLKSTESGTITCEISADLPDTVKDHITRLQEARAPIVELVEWDGFHHWKPTLIKDYWTTRNYASKDENAKILCISCYEGYAEFDIDKKTVSLVTPEQQAEREITRYFRRRAV